MPTFLVFPVCHLFAWSLWMPSFVVFPCCHHWFLPLGSLNCTEPSFNQDKLFMLTASVEFLSSLQITDLTSSTDEFWTFSIMAPSLLYVCSWLLLPWKYSFFSLWQTSHLLLMSFGFLEDDKPFLLLVSCASIFIVDQFDWT